MLRIADLQRYLPAPVKYRLKRYYRTFFPDRLILYFTPTARCNYRCSYCTVVTKFDYATVFPKAVERTAQEWIEAFGKLPPAMIYIAGGEPFVYAGLVDILNGLPSKHQVVGIVTNLSQDVRLYRKIQKPLHINASFHREYVKQEEFVAKVKELSSHFHIQVNIVATPENLPVIEEIDRDMARRGVVLHVDPYVDPAFRYSPEQRELLQRCIRSDRNPESQFDDFSEKSCSAGRNYIQVGPSGDVFTCNGGMQYLYSSLYANFPKPMDVSQFAMGNVFDPAFSLRKTNIRCCLPCKEACDRDSVAMKKVGPGPAVEDSGRLRVIA
jgi:organic radical activating enzyme